MRERSPINDDDQSTTMSSNRNTIASEQKNAETQQTMKSAARHREIRHDDGIGASTGGGNIFTFATRRNYEDNNVNKPISAWNSGRFGPKSYDDDEQPAIAPRFNRSKTKNGNRNDDDDMIIDDKP